jgi:ABC-2 type transport system ATP-binding protein
VPVIETKDLRKNYRQVRALKGVSLRVEKGEIYGLLGQNGAGKTTLVKILLGIVRSPEGQALLFGRSAGTADVRRKVGYLPEDHRFPDYHTGYSLLDFYGSLYGLAGADKRRRIVAALEQVGLKGRMNSKIRTYSKGMKQRLGIAQAFFHDPELIFLDEPTDGVDPIGRRDIRDMILDRKARGVTVFINSHLLGEVELLCDRVGILQRGEMIREGDIASLTQQHGRFLIGLKDGQAFPDAELKSRGFDVRPADEFWEVSLTESQSIDAVLDLLRDRGLNLRQLVEKRQTLEETFMQTVEAAEPGVDEPAPRVKPAKRPGGPRN